MFLRCVFFIILTLYIFNVGFLCDYSIGLSYNSVGYSFLKIRSSYNLRETDLDNDDESNGCCSTCCGSCCNRLRRFLRRLCCFGSDVTPDHVIGIYTISNPSVTPTGQEGQGENIDTFPETPGPGQSAGPHDTDKLDKLMRELSTLWNRWNEFNCRSHVDSPACSSLLSRISHLQTKVDKILNN
ncbi:hypothetical protein FG379_003232 [Cryptosporidium bovis]|uniref:uncharacterized protein n=1 Tax=Cryptosporidium bovis TaxID=310047 RepID=UPI00351A2C53|nr:hypothetical protein FG379_003232 [Cryptosporidium bovis]